MVECSPDCPNYYECDFEHCEYRDDYIDMSMTEAGRPTYDEDHKR